MEAVGVRGFSRTALGVAAHRTIHQRFDGEPKILDDPISGWALVARFPAGSEIAFSYSTPRTTPSPAAQRAGEVGEPWLTAFDQPTLARELGSLGFSPISFLDPPDLERAYFPGARDDGLAPPRTGNIGAAIVGAGEGP